MVNGQVLIKNTDYFQSTLSNYSIVFNGAILPDYVLLFYYPSAGLDANLFLKSKYFTADWTAYNDSAPGIYTPQITLASDVGFNNILYSATTIFITGNTLTNNNYSLFVATITTPNMSFLYRIRADKYFTNLLGETFITTTYSDTLTFFTDNRVLG